MPKRFPPDLLALLRDAGEIEIETIPDTGGSVHRTVIWVFVDGSDRVLIRSYRGPTARWYREALARSSVAIHASGRRIEATALVATDDDRVESASRGLLAKYRDDPATPAMVATEVLSTTLELVPR